MQEDPKTKPTKVIFLDIDGVLCTHRSHRAYGSQRGMERHFDPCAVKLVERLCIESEAVLVLSSTWRKLMTQQAMTAILMNAGMRDVPWHEDWKTEVRFSDRPRGGEIFTWLEDHPEVSRYAIIDDSSDFRECQRYFHVKTTMEDGLLYDGFEQAEKILSGTYGERKDYVHLE